MGLKENIFQAFEALNPQVDQSKAEIELNKAAIDLSRILELECGLTVIEYIINELDKGKKPLFLFSEPVNTETLSDIIEKHFSEENGNVLNSLILYFNQLTFGKPKFKPECIYDAIRHLSTTSAINKKTISFRICHNCFGYFKEDIHCCPNCKNADYWEVFKLSFNEGVKKALKDNQFLEIYTKICMEKSGIELIGWKYDKSGKKGYTSVRYQVDGDNSELDVHGITKPVAIIFCETKTVGNIIQNELRKVENTYDRLQNRLNQLTKSTNKVIKIFISTGSFDRNISLKSYQRNGWEFIERDKITNLVEEFKKIIESV